ncbi:MAG: aminodeoxychorismate/anthranilate synthase component II [Flavobacteriaceae bacterium]|nr:aminodeoxychorismate/anthranilate synthase component II [Flavobacteriaceae bacterium]
MNQHSFKIILIDNYDSFTFNLVHLIEKVSGIKPIVKRNDEVTLEEINEYDLMVLSPGPGIPSEAGKLKEIIQTYANSKPIFGVCLGLQAIVEVFGGTLENMETVYHGVSTDITVDNTNSELFKGLGTSLTVGRYHSWIASSNNFPKAFRVTAIDNQNRIMAIEHQSLPIYAVQFHPESILTPDGEQILRNLISELKN